MPFGERQPAQRFSDHDAGVGHEGIEPAEALGDRGNTVRCGFLLAHVALDQHDIARSRWEMARKAAARQIDNAHPPA